MLTSAKRSAAASGWLANKTRVSAVNRSEKKSSYGHLQAITGMFSTFPDPLPLQIDSTCSFAVFVPLFRRVGLMLFHPSVE